MLLIWPITLMELTLKFLEMNNLCHDVLFLYLFLYSVCLKLFFFNVLISNCYQLCWSHKMKVEVFSLFLIFERLCIGFVLFSSSNILKNSMMKPSGHNNFFMTVFKIVASIFVIVIELLRFFS